MGDGGEGDKGTAVMSVGRGACVNSGGISERDCCRFSVVISKLPVKNLNFHFIGINLG